MQNAAFAGARGTVALIIAVIAIVGGASGCNGCKGCTSGPSAAPTASATASAASGDHQEQPLVRALDALEILPEQSARVRAVKEALEAQSKVVRQARSELTIALAGQVRQNKIDRSALAPQIEGIKNAAHATQVGMQRAFDDLHRTLDQNQRKALLLSMKRELAQRSNAGRGEGRFRIDEVGGEIGLSPDQISKIRASLRDHVEKLPPLEGQHERRPVGQQLRAFTLAFESDTFDGSSFDLGGGDGGALAERGAELLISSAEAALPELTPDQRTKLADKFVERAHKLD